ncbi:uncharacterized protein LAJ45_10407 [Morchella importuna]|uniref:uncharacterized protein n=1 Tax=Morchella importuna TaxID=1174673 RepID=UPI001E8DA51B|nr:uncharacterized protein LAJ45_10407 [Morchella importuna]KAH8145606.1 hypothetical protein LAJ45_10407 [Morchella importuna]
MHPKCGQCDRLQHDCDYTRRLSFRDDTNRVKQRNVEVSIVGSVVWDSQVSFSNPTPQELADAKLLPPFSHLSNDEERELKAILNKPGTYHVILGPKSFENCQDSETEGENDSSPCTTPGIKSENRIEDEITWDLPNFGKRVWPNNTSYTDNESVITDDSETVFIRNFEDLSSPTNSKTSFHKQEKRSFSPEASDNSRHSSLVGESSFHHSHATENEDAIYAAHYKRYISLHFMIIQEGFAGTWDDTQLLLDTPDIFERQSKNYPRLHEAMMALAAQNYGRENGISNVKALERAQRALPVCEDMHVDIDALFSTHFFLLVYEITAAELGGDCLWQSHLDQMVRILLSRSDSNTDDRQPFITWSLVVIDTHASLSANGNGALAEILEKNNLIPDAHFLIPPTLTRKKGGVSEIEKNAFVTAMRANQKIILLGASMARLSRGFRNEASGQILSPGQCDYRQRKIEEIHGEMKSLLWREIAATVGSFKKQNSYEQCSLILQSLYEEAQAFVHACILYDQIYGNGGSDFLKVILHMGEVHISGISLFRS